MSSPLFFFIVLLNLSLLSLLNFLRCLYLLQLLTPNYSNLLLDLVKSETKLPVNGIFADIWSIWRLVVIVIVVTLVRFALCLGSICRPGGSWSCFSVVRSEWFLGTLSALTE